MYKMCMPYHTGMPQELLKDAISDYLVMGTDLFSFKLSNGKMTTTNIIIAVWCEWIKKIPICFVRLAKI